MYSYWTNYSNYCAFTHTGETTHLDRVTHREALAQSSGVPYQGVYVEGGTPNNRTVIYVDCDRLRPRVSLRGAQLLTTWRLLSQYQLMQTPHASR